MNYQKRLSIEKFILFRLSISMNGNNEHLSVSFKKSHRSIIFRTALKLVFLKKKKEKRKKYTVSKLSERYIVLLL